jgi:tRNA-specific 2-thiouridylase
VTLDIDNNLEPRHDQQAATGERKVKGIALLSGGLDSSLAVRAMLDQGILVEAVAVKTPFCDFDCGKGCGQKVKEVATELGIPLKTVYFGDDYLRMLKHPKYGYGSGMNPCIDCRSMMYKAAKDEMEKTGAEFLITGEVLMQRPMSQNPRALNIIEEESKMKGKVLRPLSAKFLPPTEAENMGLVDRAKLHSITGRSRKSQLNLAKQYAIVDPPNAAGGCLLTDPAFARRIKDAMHSTDDVPTINDVELLKVGRHFRLSSKSKLIVGRNNQENEIMGALKITGDIILEAKEYPGPIGILRGLTHDQDMLEISAAIVLRYSDAPKQGESKVKVLIDDHEIEITTVPVDDKLLEKTRL